MLGTRPTMSTERDDQRTTMMTTAKVSGQTRRWLHVWRAGWSGSQLDV